MSATLESVFVPEVIEDVKSLKFGIYSESGKSASLDLETLVKTRCLVEANSGGGKSYLLRKLMEQAYGKIQQIVFDVEGEFATIRDKFPGFILASRDRDAPREVDVDVNTADVLCRKVLELGASIIIDLYELDLHERKKYVRTFLEALIAAPKELWHPVLVYVDECHEMCPEKGHGESEASDAVIALATKGRKRGYCLPPGERIFTSDGIKPIERIVIGDLVLTEKGRFREVTAVSQRNFNGNVIRIKSYGSSFATTTTEDHLFLTHLTHNNGAGTRVTIQQSWTKASSLVVGKCKDPTRTFGPFFSEVEDLKHVSVVYEARNRLPTTKKGLSRRRSKIFNLSVNPEFLRVSGWYISEGSLAERKHSRGKYLSKTVFSLGASEGFEIETLRKDLKILGLKSYVTPRGTGVSVTVCGRPFAELMNFLYGRGAEKKTIPISILRLPKDKLVHLFGAYMAGDGHWFSNQSGWRGTATTVSLELAFRLKLIGGRLGYFTSLQTCPPRTQLIKGRVVSCKEKYTISFSVDPRNSKKFEDDSYCQSVLSKELIPYIGPVYDIEVKEDSSFSTISHIVHNCAIMATQRISKFNKDAAAELNNVLIGRTGLDIDQKRAAQILGFTGQQQTLSMRELKPGHFYAFGPAFKDGVNEVIVSKVESHHPSAGEKAITFIPQTPKEIKPFLEKLSEIPQVKKRELKEKEDFVAEIKDLRGKLQSANYKVKQLESGAGAISPEKVKDIEDRAYARGQKAMEQQVSSQLKQSQSLIKRYQQGFAGIGKIASDVAGMSVPEFKAPEIASSVRRPVVLPSPVPVKATTAVQTDIELGRCERAILKFLAMRPDKDFTKQQVGAMTNYSPTSGGFSNAVSKLNTSGLINYGNNRLSLSQQRLDDIIAFLGNEYSEPSKDALESWLGKLELAPRKIYELLLRNPDQTFSKQEIAEQTGYSAGSGGFSNAISNLNTLGLIEKTGEGIRLNQELRDL